MSKIGSGSGVDLVRRMQPGRDLEHAWIIFDQVKRVTNWTTMACNVYDATYQCVMTIACYDFQSEDKDVQIIFGRISTMLWQGMYHRRSSKDSWLIARKPIGMQFGLSMVAVI